MKNLSLVFAVFFFQNYSVGQVEFAPVGAEWCYHVDGGAVPIKGYLLLKYVGDTTIQTKPVKVLEAMWVYESFDTAYHTYYTYQSADSIYRFTSWNNQFTYSFRNNVNIGETVEFYDGGLIMVQNVETINFGNAEIKKYGITWSGWPQKTVLLDRAGAALGFIDSWYAPAFDGEGYHLRWYKDHQIPYFQVSGGPCEDMFTSNFERIEGIGISTFPNPASNTLRVDFSQEMFGRMKVQIFDLTGKPVLQEKEVIGNQLEVGQLTPGLYILMMENDGRRYRTKFVKD